MRKLVNVKIPTSRYKIRDGHTMAGEDNTMELLTFYAKNEEEKGGKK